jgi:hypothetical protein
LDDLSPESLEGRSLLAYRFVGQTLASLNVVLSYGVPDPALPISLSVCTSGKVPIGCDAARPADLAYVVQCD